MAAGLTINQRRVLWELAMEDGLNERELHRRVRSRYVKRPAWGATAAAIAELEQKGMIRRTSSSSTSSWKDPLTLVDSEKAAGWRSQGYATAARFRERLITECHTFRAALLGGATGLATEVDGLDTAKAAPTVIGAPRMNGGAIVRGGGRKPGREPRSDLPGGRPAWSG